MNNRVGTSDMESSQPTENLHKTSVGPLAFIFAISIIIISVYYTQRHNATCKILYGLGVWLDFSLILLPIYWVISSDEILGYIALKFNQFKLNLGLF